MTLLARSLGAGLCRHAARSTASTSAVSASSSSSRMLAATRLPRATTSASFSTTSAALANALLFLEHKGGRVNPASLVAATAASKLSGNVDGLIVGETDFDSALEQATK